MADGVLLAADYKPFLNKSFSAKKDDFQSEFELVEVKEFENSEEQIRYSLVFKAPNDAPPEQGLYTLSAEGFEETMVFLVPVAQKRDHIQFEAVYNLVPDF